MKFLKYAIIIMAIAALTGAGIYLCNDVKTTEKVQEAVMI